MQQGVHPDANTYNAEEAERMETQSAETTIAKILYHV